jgi:phosphoribosylformylglycinamidine cyclo-ligase
VKGLAHITGGGFIDNIPRVLPKSCNVDIWKDTWPVLPIFNLLAEKGSVPEPELYQVFNMGIGMTIFVPRERTAAVLNSIATRKLKAWVIGEITQGNGEVKIH